VRRDTTLRKSRSITLTLMTGFAAACSDGRGGADRAFDAASVDETPRCVDEQNRVVGDSLCTRPRHGGGFYPFLFYYGGRTFTQGGATYVTGGRRVSVGGGAPVYAPSQRGPVSRGGLGATAARRGGGSFGG
jgi:hypothetical protein